MTTLVSIIACLCNDHDRLVKQCYYPEPDLPEDVITCLVHNNILRNILYCMFTAISTAVVA